MFGNINSSIMSSTIIRAAEIIEALKAVGSAGQVEVLSRFFKTGKGQYGEGDRFLGVKVPQTRAIVKEAKLSVPFGEISILLDSEWHEARLAGLLLLVEEMKAVSGRTKNTEQSCARRKEIVDFYLSHATRSNNWDLVDLSCPYIVGVYLLHEDEDAAQMLDDLSASTNLWEQRIAIVSTMMLIRNGRYAEALRISEKLLGHPHDLIHKAVGWMLRETGKRDRDLLIAFLERHHSHMPRTTLRYAIEKLSPDERRHWMQR